ncbi:helix-turn-helix domain-containing protein [Myxacorys almedinensis]|uniref:Helix-turn-helix domain-containing protein n=1 Tax=Myxacorys almedinensis A TaxID=2690445 RepID=A0A8J7Z0E0_9CYAN|nr:AraC family transcriptional regulator [Myxacorys almedinensis]NDJ17937.1 helix-turn-helix domain-containing protein [Myxacorys almedinensis A]
MAKRSLAVIDYRQANAASPLLPQPSIFASNGWSHLHLEVFHQPEFEIAEHQHTMHVIAYSPISADLPASSTGERWLDDQWCCERRHQGDVAIIPAGVAHRCNWNTSVQFVILAIEPILLQQVGQDWVEGDRIELIPQFMNQPDSLIQGMISTLRDELQCNKIASNLLIDSLKTTLAIHLLRNYCTVQPRFSNHSNGLSRSTLQRVTEYIHAHLHQDLRLVELSAIAQLSPYHFLRLFKQQLKITPHQYILQCRIEQAKYLLQHSELSLAEIAIRVGFCDQSHLTRSFKRIVGVTPKQLL